MSASEIANATRVPGKRCEEERKGRGREKESLVSRAIWRADTKKRETQRRIRVLDIWPFRGFFSSSSQLLLFFVIRPERPICAA